MNYVGCQAITPVYLFAYFNYLFVLIISFFIFMYTYFYIFILIFKNLLIIHYVFLWSPYGIRQTIYIFML